VSFHKLTKLAQLSAAILLIFFLGCSNIKISKNKTIKVLHYNIFEMETSKISQKNPQLHAAKGVISALEFDLFSVNELQYDLPRVPTPIYDSTGENLARLLNLLKPKSHIHWYYSFFPANTGSMARQKKNSHYVTSKHKNARAYADPNNYGLFPGQYSTGLASRYPIKKRKVISKLSWMTFNPQLNLKEYESAKGSSLPIQIELFDKNFVDTIVMINKEPVHVVTLHTVPAYHFGNKKTPNYQRNADQLAFLEWYLDPSSPLRGGDVHKALLKQGITPLEKGEHFVAMGDWNTDIKANNPGSHILKRLYRSLGLKFPQNITHETKGFSPKPFNMQLDYIIYSQTLTALREEVLRSRPAQMSLSCRKKLATNELFENKLVPLKSNNTKKKGEKCNIMVPKAYAQQKLASDHFALYAELQFKEN
jgi:endonuclease/exonuclease/phosphatase family metal-dependent hydrolase